MAKGSIRAVFPCLSVVWYLKMLSVRWHERGSKSLVLLLVLSCLCTLFGAEPRDFRLDERSPFYQHLQDCDKGNYIRPQKKTKWKGILCPMVKNEEGFLSEWVAYYEVQGFNKIIIFDNNSTSSMAELQPWIAAGFVEIIKSPWWDSPWLFRQPQKKFFDMMHIKYLSECICKQRGVELGMDVFASIDIDEYVVPRINNATLMDDFEDWFMKTKRGILVMEKYNYNSVPHILEPLNLLTIEAYQTRVLTPRKMNYYTQVAAKIALRLQQPENPEFNNDTQRYVVTCCDFHGCNGVNNHKVCHPLNQKGERWKLEGRHLPWADTPRMNHYSRSLEKFLSKQKHYETASHGKTYDIGNFFDRSFGYYYDPNAVPWGCFVREKLRNRTGEQDYVRPGDSWYRNPEFGRAVEDPSKRGRHGSAYGKVLGWEDMNPFPEGDTYQRAHKPYKSPNRRLRINDRDTDVV